MVSLFFLIPIGVLAASTAAIFIKLCDAPALIIATYRMVFASLILLPYALYKKKGRTWERKEIGWLIVSGLFLSLHFAFWISSLKYTSVASSVVLVTTYPIFVGIGSRLFLKERMGLSLIFGIILSVLGSGLISYGDMAISREVVMGDGLALLGAVTVSGYFLVGRKMRKSQDLLSYIFPVYSAAGFLLVIFSLSSQKNFFGYSWTTYLFLFLLALIPQLIGHTTINWALKYLPASMVAITYLGEPVGSTLLAYLILNEALTRWKVFGGILILAGILAALKRSPQNLRKE
jgi:drug/metabolite transporter (DMT)-like permease